MAPLWPGAPTHGIRPEAEVLWDELESVGVPEVHGVHVYNAYLVVISIRQRYAGHTKQAAYVPRVACHSLHHARHGTPTVEGERFRCEMVSDLLLKPH